MLFATLTVIGFIVAKKILMICGNPKAQSFCEHLAETYVQAAADKHSVRIVKLAELNFDPNLTYGYRQPQPLEADLLALSIINKLNISLKIKLNPAESSLPININQLV